MQSKRYKEIVSRNSAKEDVFKKIKVLSGGERIRLKLCILMNKDLNLLILDEPTNHMDIVGKESLEDMLKEFKGTLIFVSHDRYFVNKIADFEKNGIFDQDVEEAYRRPRFYRSGWHETYLKEYNKYMLSVPHRILKKFGI